MELENKILIHYNDIPTIDDRAKIRIEVEKITFGDVYFRLKEGEVSVEKGFLLELDKWVIFVPIYTRLGEFLKKIYDLVEGLRFNIYISFKGKDENGLPIYDVDYILRTD